MGSERQMIDSNKEILKDIQAQYDLSEISTLIPIKSWGNTARWCLTSIDQKKYFFKEKVFYLTEKEFKLRLDFHKFLKKNGAPVTHLKETLSGHTYFKYGKRYFELQEWIDHRPVNKENLDEVSSFGISLAKFIRAGDKYDELEYVEWSFPRARSKFFPDHPSLFRDYFKILNGLEDKEEIPLQLIKGIQLKAQELISKIEWDRLPISWLHGDASLDNTIYQLSNNQLILIDLDNARKGYRLWDIARSLAIIGAFDIDSITSKIVRTNWDIYPMQAVIKGFHENCPFNYFERKAIKSCVALACVIAFISEFDLDDPVYGICDQTKLKLNIEKLFNILHNIEHLELGV